MMMPRRKKEGAAALIPIDLHEEILSRLPSDAVSNFKRVSKDWMHLISSPRFIQKHLERSNLGGNRARIIIPYKSSGLEIIHSENNITKKIPLGDVHSFLGSCDGLVLCLLRGGTISAVNPTTGKFVVRTMRNDFISILDRSFICSWFGHHPSTGEYVLVIANFVKSPTSSSTITFQGHSLSPNTSNPLVSSSTHHLIDDEEVWDSGLVVGTFLHGRLHFPLSLIPLIIDGYSLGIVILVHSFQVNGNTERMSCPVKSCPTLGVVDGCLSIICKEANAFELWMMKEYGVKESWAKFANIEGYNNIYYEYMFLGMFIFLEFCPNGYVILKSGGDGSRIVMYSFRNSEPKIRKASTRCYNTSIVCIDSLVSPDSLVLGEKAFD